MRIRCDPVEQPARPAIAVLLAFCLFGCSAQSASDRGVLDDFGVLGSSPSRTTAAQASVQAIPRGPDAAPRRSVVEFGSGKFIEGAGQKQIEVDATTQNIALNFVDVDLQDFVRAVFDEVLKESVIVDASLKGRITLRAPNPVSRAVALEMVRQALQASGASLVSAGGINRVVAKSDQRGSKRLGDSIRILPLQYIGAEEAKAALAPFSQSGVDVAAAPSGRYLTISGAASDIDNLEEVLGSLDVDQMKGMSFGLFPLKEALANAVSTELGQMFNKDADARGFRSIPISRMNAVLLITPRPGQLAAAQKWIGRLDRADHDERKVYVYPVQNRSAAEIAKTLTAVLDGGSSKTPEQQSNPVSPALTTTTASIPARQTSSSGFSQVASTSNQGSLSDAADRQAPDAGGRRSRISADLSTNSIVVTASPEEWKIIDAALRRLDIMPPQVLIEATIAEVTLNDTLSHGVRWFFQKGLHGVGVTDGSVPSAAGVGGFTYSFGIPQANVVISALEQVTDVQIVSSPALTVLDNQTAKLQVGDQVPIATRTSQSVVNPDAPTVNDIEFRDTGIILSVTPRVNASGLVILDITQEVSDVVPTTTSNLNSPTIRQRKINSSVAVQSGREIVLGGLMGMSSQRSDNGVPGLISVPIFGNLFKTQAQNQGGRTEFLVILRPTVLGSRMDIQTITDEIKSRMSAIRGARFRPSPL